MRTPGVANPGTTRENRWQFSVICGIKSTIESLFYRRLAVRDVRFVTESWCHSVIDLFFPEVTIKRSRPTAAPQSNLPRMNERIRISPIRVVSATGEMLGEMETAAALRIALDEGLDLVEVSPEARPQFAES